MTKWLFIGSVFAILGTFLWRSNPPASGCLVGKANPSYRFGIAAPYAVEGYDLPSLNVDGFIDWHASPTPNLPEGMDYLRVLKVGDSIYSKTLADLPGWLSAYPGSVWLVGNEPDRYFYQDSVTAETYAERYFALATIIRNADPTAQIGFGTVVQPTPIRMRYLQRALDRLAQLAGGSQQASALIDIWSIHSFILNEDPNEWGAGVPVGFENDYIDAIHIPISNYHDTHSISIFSQRIIDFRQWMAQIGERNKPLWITEYGSLFPPIDPVDTNYYNVSDADTAAFMVSTFDFLLYSSDADTGYPSDGNHLVQRWFWYSLNEHRYTFGGTLFDPDNGKAITPVGDAFIQYTSRLPNCYVYIPHIFR